MAEDAFDEGVGSRGRHLSRTRGRSSGCRSGDPRRRPGREVGDRSATGEASDIPAISNIRSVDSLGTMRSRNPLSTMSRVPFAVATSTQLPASPWSSAICAAPINADASPALATSGTTRWNTSSADHNIELVMMWGGALVDHRHGVEVRSPVGPRREQLEPGAGDRVQLREGGEDRLLERYEVDRALGDHRRDPTQR